MVSIIHNPTGLFLWPAFSTSEDDDRGAVGWLVVFTAPGSIWAKPRFGAATLRITMASAALPATAVTPVGPFGMAG